MIQKITAPISILLATFIAGGFFFTVQMYKQNSAERQWNKEYIVKRKNECYGLYEKERSKWNNVKGSEYDKNKDVCMIRYHATDEWQGKKCDNYLPKDDTPDSIKSSLIKSYLDCIDNSFTKEF